MNNTSLDKLLQTIKSRVPWPVMKQVLNHNKIEKGRGWDDTIAKLNNDSVNDKEKVIKIIEKLNNFYINHLESGEKAIRFYKDDNEKLTAITSAFETYTIPTSKFKDAYPFPLDESELQNAENGVILVNIKKSGNNLYLFFCSNRVIEERVELIPNELEDEAKKALSEYSEVIGIKRQNKQFFDIVKISKDSNTVEVRIDISSKISADERENSFKSVIKKFNELGTMFLKDDYCLNSVINFFPVINKIYRSNEGRVCELAFTTQTSSIKHEKMRRRHECLRSEAYHQGGSNAVGGNISPYRVAITWEHADLNSPTTQPELLLPGHSSMLQGNKSLAEAIITNCAGADDYGFVLNKLINFI